MKEEGAIRRAMKLGRRVEVTLRRGGKSLTGATCKYAAFVPFDFAHPLLCHYLDSHYVNDFVLKYLDSNKAIDHSLSHSHV